MKLYIQVENGVCVNHPALEDNLLQAFGSIPENWEPFVRVECPSIGVYEILDPSESTYQKIGDNWMDVWVLRPMTSKEKSEKQNAVRNKFNSVEQAENWSAWIFDEETCTMIPPIPRPEQDEEKRALGIFTFWSGAENNWKDSPPYPNGNHKFDFIQWKWVEVNDGE